MQANMCQYHYELHHEIVTINITFVLYVSRQAMPASLSQTCLRKKMRQNERRTLSTLWSNERL